MSKAEIGAGVGRRSLLLAMGGASLAAGLGAAPLPGAAASREREGAAVLDVAIIGAGLSGLTSARDLKRAGCESFAVLEARDRVGGRTWNHDIGGGVVAEAGGQWIGPGQTAVADLARELDVATFDSFYHGKSVYLMGEQRLAADVGNGGVVGGAEVVRRLNDLSRHVPSAAPWTAPDAAALDQQSLGSWLKTQTLTDDDRIAFDLSARLTFGAAPDTLSLLHYLSIINTSGSDLSKLEAMAGGAQEKRLVGGSYVLSARMAAALPDKIRLRSPVRQIVGWDRDVAEVQTDRGVIRARRVIVAMSPSLCRAIAFDPPLPAERREMIAAWPTVGRMRKTVHVYPKPFWRDAGLNGQVMEIGGALLWSADNSPPDASVGILTAFVREGALPADQDRARDLLSATYARALGKAALRPTQYHEVDWGTVDPWSLFCTSPYPPGFLTRFGRLMGQPTGAILWSGTDMAEIWQGAMDGAIRAGHRAALRALA